MELHLLRPNCIFDLQKLLKCKCYTKLYFVDFKRFIIRSSKNQLQLDFNELPSVSATWYVFKLYFL